MKKIVIIGAGISGLSAGCYAAMNGYEVQIVEAHSLPGGLCTSWKRNGYLIDDSCHSLMGSGPGSAYHQIWQELGAIQGRRIVDYEYFAGMTALDGRVFRLYTDLDRLERHMKELSPADAAPTEEFVRVVRRFADFNVPVGKPAELMGLLDGLKMMRRFLPFMKLFGELLSLTLESFAARFKDPLLRDGIRNANYGASGTLFSIVMPLAWMSRKDGGYPIGGSLALARAIEARFTGLGGTVRYGSRVTKVLERNGRATGVRLEDGTEMEADWVIAACDMKSTLTGLLDGSRIDPVHKELLDSGTLTGPVTQVAVGANLDLVGQPCRTVGGLPAAETHLHRWTKLRVVQRQELRLRSRHGASRQVGAPQHVPLRVVALGKAQGRPRGLHGREGANRRRMHRGPGDALPRHPNQGRDGRRRHAAHLRAVHRELEGDPHDLAVQRRVPEAAPLHPQDRARPGRLLSREHVDECSRQPARRGRGRQVGCPAHLCAGQAAVRDDHPAGVIDQKAVALQVEGT